MMGEAVTGHLMPVLTGPQGNGKTTAILKMLSPLAGVERKVNFAEITDNRNMELWRSFVLFADEMEKAQKADVEAIKGVITAETLDRRVLGAMRMEKITQCATFIGAANSSLGANIRDTTGLRRFAPLPTLGRPGHSERAVDWDTINAIDIEALWRSVQVNHPDPMIPHQGELARLQEEEREKGAVELWFEHIDVATLPGNYFTDGGGIRAEDLFRLFREFEDENFPSGGKTSVQTWGRDMTRLVNLNPAKAKFSRKRLSRGMIYFPASAGQSGLSKVVAMREDLRRSA